MPKKRQSTFDDLINVAARLPWWASVLPAVVTFGIFHLLAGSPTRQVHDVTGLGAAAASGLIATVAKFLQYLIPAAFLLGAAISAIRGKNRARLHDQAENSPTLAVLGDMSWNEFEILVVEAFRRKGFRVLETGLGGADGGVDLDLVRDNERYLVQCKHWRAQKVGVAVVRELYGVMAARQAAGGFVVTSGRFTPDATTFAVGRNVHLIDGSGLHGMLRGARAAVPLAPRVVPAATPSVAPASPPADAVPSCPMCASPMVRRTVRSGRSAGQAFWGCATFPKCRGTRAIEKATA